MSNEVPIGHGSFANTTKETLDLFVGNAGMVKCIGLLTAARETLLPLCVGGCWRSLAETWLLRWLMYRRAAMFVRWAGCCQKHLAALGFVCWLAGKCF